MADIPINKSRGKRYIGGASPIVPSYVQGDAPPPNNPPGSGSLGNFVTLDTAQTITGEKTFDARVRVTNNEISITNWVSASGAYDKLSLNLGENRGVGYDPFLNQLFFAGTITVPLKVDTDAPTDSLEILPSGGLKMDNIPTGTPVSSLGLDVNNEVVASTALVQTTDTFTPTLSASGLSFTYTTQVGYCTKIGTMVFYRIELNFSATGTPSGGGLKISGIPVGFRGVSGELQYLQVGKFQNSGYTDAEVSLLVGEINGNVDGITIVEKNSAFAPLTTYTNCGLDISGFIKST